MEGCFGYLSHPAAMANLRPPFNPLSGGWLERAPGLENNFLSAYTLFLLRIFYLAADRALT
jgi:hypothetical protein